MNDGGFVRGHGYVDWGFVDGSGESTQGGVISDDVEAILSRLIPDLEYGITSRLEFQEARLDPLEVEGRLCRFGRHRVGYVSRVKRLGSGGGK